jgi:tetratricopeptide (TPR) repeat protein
LIEQNWPRGLHAPTALAASGALLAVLAAVDKLVGLVQHPLHLATLSYACLAALLGWLCVHGLPLRTARRPLRLSGYTAALVLTMLTGAYVFAWRASADPTPVILQNELRHGDELLADDRAEEALLVYKEAYKRFPKAFMVLLRLGDANYRLTDYERARRYYERALGAAPASERWRALQDLGQTYWKLRQPQDAVEYYERARDAGVPPDEMVEWHYRAAWAYFDADDLDSAIEHYTAVAVAGDKYVAASYYNIACARAQKLAKSTDPQARRQLAREAVQSLQQAWKTTDAPSELESFRSGLLGSEQERDPDLAPLRGTPEFAAFLQQIRKG